jgi:NADH-quinone oxidoreductase subunit N
MNAAFYENVILPLMPFLILSLGGVLVLVLDAIWPRGRRLDANIVAIPVVLTALVALAYQWRHPNRPSTLGGMYLTDGFGAFIGIAVCLALVMTFLLSQHYLRQMGRQRGEYYALLLFSASGMVLFSSATELLTLFLGLELVSLPVYLLSGYFRDDSKSNEAGMKYFLLGAFSSAIFLFGVALVYGATGHTDLAEAVMATSPMPGLLTLGLVVLMAGLLFKVASVPFHMWVPDVYEGAPTAVTAFMATAVKASAFGALVRVFVVSLPALSTLPMEKVFWWLAVLSMTVGNLAALTQSNIKRMLAYSSIAHVGYILVGITAIAATGSTEPVAGILYYLLAYTFMNLCAFGVIIALSEKGRETLDIDQMGGLGWRYPGLGLAMVLAMVALSGIPPTAGFFAKYYVFQSAVQAGLVGLVVIGVLNTALSVYYYLRVLVAFFMKPAAGEISPSPSVGVGVTLAFASLAILWIAIGPDGILPGVPRLLGWVRDSLVALP